MGLSAHCKLTSGFYVIACRRIFIAARKRSLRRLCFHRCLSVHGGWGICIRGGLRPEGGLHRGVLGRPPPNQILWETVNERAVRILLECILAKCKKINPVNTSFTLAVCGNEVCYFESCSEVRGCTCKIKVF